MEAGFAELTRLVETGCQQAVAALRAAAARGGSVDELTGLLRVAFCQRNQLDAALSGVIAELDRAAAAAGPDGEATSGLSCASWLAHTLHINPGAAHAQVRLARQLPSLPATSEAFERGDLSAQHASVVARSVEQVGRGGGDVALAEDMLLREAEQRDPRDLFRWGLSLVHRLAPAEMEADEERRRQRRSLRLVEVFSGGYEVSGYLDPVGGATLKTALDGLMGPRARDDERTPDQRRADALVELAGRVLDSGGLRVRGGQRPHLTVTASLETLRADPGAPAALLDWGFPISGRALRRIADDAEITPILMSARGDPLHVGRRYRTATPKMRKALAVRDRHCVWPGCDRPPHWTEGDHVEPWGRGGPTEVELLRLLCRPHHQRLRRGWRLDRMPDGSYVVRPPRRLTQVAVSPPERSTPVAIPPPEPPAQVDVPPSV